MALLKNISGRVSFLAKTHRLLEIKSVLYV